MEHGRLAGIYIPAAWKNENFSRTACLWSYDMPNARINVRITRCLARSIDWGRLKEYQLSWNLILVQVQSLQLGIKQ